MRVHRRGKGRRAPLTPALRAVLEHGVYPAGASDVEAYQALRQVIDARVRGGVSAAWQRWGEQVMATWVPEYRGHVPFAATWAPARGERRSGNGHGAAPEDHPQPEDDDA